MEVLTHTQSVRAGVKSINIYSSVWKLQQAVFSHIEAITAGWRCEFDLLTLRCQCLSLGGTQYNGTCLASRWELLSISEEFLKDGNNG